MSTYKGPRGTYDVYPGGREPHERPELWTFVEAHARDFFRRYNYAEIRTPIFEELQLFARSAGESSDIVVKKEMFAFRDMGGRELALRPEGTPGAVRAYLEHNLFKRAQPIKLFYVGPMFRQERQQRGRYRQHTQIGAEVLGSDDPLVDVEVIALLYGIHQAVGVSDEVVYLNNLGDMETRRNYVPELRSFLHKHRAELDPDSVARLETNPLRTFDSKDENTQALLEEAPTIGDFLSPEAAGHLTAVEEGLGSLGIPYEVDERLVRGLDYYTMTVFEAKSGALGAQDTVGAGGRYNGLVSELGGPDLPGIGFGSGVERILLAAASHEVAAPLGVFFVTLDPEARLMAVSLANALRAEGVSCDLDYAQRSAKGQFRQADRSGAAYAAILGEVEIKRSTCTVRDMNTGEEHTVSVADGAKELLRAVTA
ncbi:MAG: histidine--tRNA ligase [Actinomycetota bacterium]|nr:histidine--tRNA ligase [Actinomycetota bacterium]MDQ5818364.1 histidine--tRNA ligase [Actinomycetota bacterium]MDQ5830535.1 histidine--tRNA ligase [Actinomycetota bacterium]